MASTFIEGYLATITIGGVAYELYAARAEMDLEQEAMENTHLSDRNHTQLPGLQGGTISVELHAATEFANAINTAYDGRAQLAFVFRIGDLTKDAGSRAGDALIESFTQAGAADDEWDMTLQLIITGPTIYTAPV